MTNIDKYREMSEPHESTEAVQVAFDAFIEDVRVAREKHRIANVVFTISTFYKGEERTLEVGTHGGLGDNLRAESMLAWALGQVQRERQERIAEYLSPPNGGRRAGGAFR